MIHEVHDWMLELDLSDFDIITFDDGLYSQYRNYKHFLKFNKPMYFFISTGIVNYFEEQLPEVVSSSTAHEDWRKNISKKYFMTWLQIKEIQSNELCNIGGHGCYHHDLRNTTVEKQIRTSRSECINMLDDFKDHGIKIDSFCFPYNFDAYGWRTYLEKVGVTKFFGSERTPIETLRK